jgi:hypothetical protein
MRSPISPKGWPQAHFGTLALHNRALRITGKSDKQLMLRRNRRFGSTTSSHN